MAALTDTTVAVLATDGFEERELTEPVKALRDAGATVEIIAPRAGEIQAFKHHDKSIKVKVDKTLDQVRADEYDAVLLPGGALNADAMRVEPQAKQFFDSLPTFYRNNYMRWINSAKRPPTRAARIAEMMELLKAGKREK